MNFTLRSLTVVALAYAAACGGGTSGGADASSDATMDDGAVDSGTKKDSGLKDSGISDSTPPDDAPQVTVNPECTVEADAGSGGSCITLTGDGGVECNPVTNAPCRADAGEACDFSSGGFHCYGPTPVVNTAVICANCDDQNGPACAGTGTCVPTMSGNQCARFCCVDGDCLAGHCDMATLQTAPVGVCVQ